MTGALNGCRCSHSHDERGAFVADPIDGAATVFRQIEVKVSGCDVRMLDPAAPAAAPFVPFDRSTIKPYTPWGPGSRSCAHSWDSGIIGEPDIETEEDLQDFLEAWNYARCSKCGACARCCTHVGDAVCKNCKGRGYTVGIVVEREIGPHAWEALGQEKTAEVFTDGTGAGVRVGDVVRFVELRPSGARSGETDDRFVIYVEAIGDGIVLVETMNE